jgi:hypothetical protein
MPLCQARVQLIARGWLTPTDSHMRPPPALERGGARKGLRRGAFREDRQDGYSGLAVLQLPSYDDQKRLL